MVGAPDLPELPLLPDEPEPEPELEPEPEPPKLLKLLELAEEPEPVAEAVWLMVEALVVLTRVGF